MKIGDMTPKDWHLAGHLRDGMFDNLKMGDVRVKVEASPAECPFCHKPWPTDPEPSRWTACPGAGNYETKGDPTRIWFLRDPEGKVMARSNGETVGPERIEDLADELNRGSELASVVWDFVDLLVHRPLIDPKLHAEKPAPWFLEKLDKTIKRGGDLVEYETPPSGMSP